MYFIGLDPGSKGGIVIVDYDSKPVLVMDLDKLTDHDVVTELKYFVNSLNTSTAVESQVFAALEDTVYMSAEKKGAVKYGENCGFLRGVLTTLDIPFERVSPQKWKKALGIKMGGGTQTEKKKRSKTKAQQLYPSHRWTNNTAEAYLLAVYAMKYSIRPISNK